MNELSIHKLASEEFNPQNYEIIDYLDNKPPVCGGLYHWANAERATEITVARFEAWREEFRRVGFGDRIPHNCEHCGQHIRYVVATKHRVTGEAVAIGCDCAAYRLNMDSRGAIQRWLKERRAAIKGLREQALAEAVEFLTNDPDFAAIFREVTNFDMEEQKQATEIPFIVLDICRKFRDSGQVTAAQRNAVVKVYNIWFDRAQSKTIRQAQWAQEKANAGDAPEGRCKVQGECVFVKFYENDFGGSYKAIIKTTNGSTVFVSLPSSCDDPSALKGKEISLTASFSRKSDDSKFAFGKRPHGLEIVKGRSLEV